MANAAFTIQKSHAFFKQKDPHKEYLGSINCLIYIYIFYSDIYTFSSLDLFVFFVQMLPQSCLQRNRNNEFVSGVVFTRIGVKPNYFLFGLTFLCSLRFQKSRHSPPQNIFAGNISGFHFSFNGTFLS